MKIKRVVLHSFLLGIFLLSASMAHAQEDYQKKYLTGRDLVKNGKYTAAMDVLKPLTSEAPENYYVKYAHYFYSLAAFKAKQFDDARQMLKQLTLRYTQWDKIDDAYYLLANVAFEQKRYKEAIKYLENRKKVEKDDIDKMKAYYLGKAPTDTLQALHKVYPADPVVAKYLAQRLIFSPNEKDKMLVEYLVQEFRLEKENLQKKKKGMTKASYNVAVLFPFMVNEIHPENAQRSNQFVLDLYEGIRVAVDSLKRKGVNINLYAYDTEKDPAKVATLLQQQELEQMDLLIGPIYPSHNQLVNDFALKNSIPVVNPLSTNPKLFEGNPEVILFQASLDDQAEAVADYAVKHFTDPLKKDVIIFYGNEHKDSLLAVRYREVAKAKGFNVKVFEKNKISLVQPYSEAAKLSTVNHFFVPTSDVSFAANIISSLEISNEPVPVFTRSEWLNFRLLSYEQLERREVHFLHPEFVDYNRPQVKDLKRAYVDVMRSLPSVFSYQGYDLMTVFGNFLNIYGTGFKEYLNTAGPVPGKVFPVYNYANSSSNQFLPLTKFVDHELKVINSPLAPLDQKQDD